jgi:PAS domain S-box-containing protein
MSESDVALPECVPGVGIPARQLLESCPDGFIALDPRWRITYVNPAAERINGQSREELLGRDHWDVFPAAVGTPVDDGFRRVMEERSPLRFENFYEPWGRWFEIDAFPTPDGGIAAWYRDVTDRKRAEQELRRRETELTDFVENAVVGLHWVGPDGTILWANRAELDLLGYERDEYVGRNITEFHADPPVIADILCRLKEGQELHSYEARLRCKDGSVRTVLISSNVLYENGEFRHTRCFTRDVTDRRRAEDALRDSEAKYRTLFDSIDEGFCILEVLFDERQRPVDYRYLEFNAAFERQSGLTDALGKRVREFFPEHESHWFESYGRVALTGETTRFVNHAVGFDRWFDVYAFRVGPAEARRVAVLFTDITGRKRAEALVAGQNRALELAVRGAPPADVLDVLARTAETQSAGGVLASVLLLDRDGTRLRHGAAPSLPDDYNRAIDGLAIGPSVGSCGTAAYAGREVVVSDIASDPLWADFRGLALTHGLRACWSTPISSSCGETLGTFALYYREPKSPPEADRQVVELLSRTAAVVIERHRETDERRRAEAALRESEARLSEVFRQAPSFMCVLTGPDHVFAHANDRYLELVGRRDLLGKPIRDALPEIEGQGFFELLDGVYRTGQPFAGQGAPVRIVREAGRLPEERRLDFVYQALRGPGGAVTGIFVQGVDVTERSRAEEALREADRRKDQFLATLAHELRNPLAPISNALQVWPLVEHDPTEAARLREMMGRQVGQMVRLIDDLLDVSRITRGKIELRKETVELASVVEGALESVRPLLDSCGHELSVSLPSEPITLDGDPGRLMQVFGNLLNNACKYAGRNGHVWLAAAREGDSAAVTVRDDGPGIPRDMLDRIFEMFTQVDQTLDRAHGGLGIGLTLARTLVELHGGSIEARSDGPGRGAEFVVRLPIARQAAPRPAAPVPSAGDQPESLPRLRVLVVDDMKPSANTLAMMLKSLGQETRAAYDGPAAVAAAAEFRPDLVISDIAMPGMDGLALAARLRRDDGTGPALVALTGYGQEQDRRRALDAGFHRHLVKPTSVAALRELLASLGAKTAP